MSQLSTHITSRSSAFGATAGRIGAPVRAGAGRARAATVASEADEP